MNKLNKTQQEKVETARAAIIQLQEAQHLLYSRLVDEVEQDNDWLYDYVFNCAEDDAYTVKVRSEIFE